MINMALSWCEINISNAPYQSILVVFGSVFCTEKASDLTSTQIGKRKFEVYEVGRLAIFESDWC